MIEINNRMFSIKYGGGEVRSLFLFPPSVFSVYSAVKNLIFLRALGVSACAERSRSTVNLFSDLRQIEGIDRQIDLLVYELYGLNKEEIGIAEGPRQGMEGEEKL